MSKKQPSESIEKLTAIMAHLRSEHGCPWDQVQTPESLKPHVLEETYEVLASLGENDPEEIKKELGDLLLQIVFLARIFEERGEFNFGDVADSISEKLIRRHPHVFGTVRESNISKLNEQWESIKLNEMSSKPDSLLANIPNNFPALILAHKISARVAKVGFDWESHEDVFEKLEEEISELKNAIADKNKAAMKDELGDLLFTLVNIGRHLEVDSETALLQMLDRFKSRFQLMESILLKENRNIEQTDIETLNVTWQQAKRILNLKS